MTERRLHDKPACSEKAAPYPVEVSCAHCGEDVEVWSDEDESPCSKCGSTILIEDQLKKI